MSFDSLVYMAEIWAPDADLLQREETFTAIASCATYYVIGTTHSNLFVFSTNGNFLVSLNVGKHVSRDVTMVGSILHIACSASCCVAFATGTGLVWCWNWKQDTLECWSSREDKVVALQMPSDFDMSTGTLYVSHKPSSILALRGGSSSSSTSSSSSSSSSRRTSVLSVAWHDASTAAPSLRNLCCEQEMLLFSMHHQVFCCDPSTGTILSSFRQQLSSPASSNTGISTPSSRTTPTPTPTARDTGTNPESQRTAEQRSAARAHTPASCDHDDAGNNGNDANDSNACESGVHGRSATAAATTTATATGTREQSRTPPHVPSHATLVNTGGVEETEAVQAIVCAGEHVYVHYTSRVYLFVRNNFRTAPFRLVRIIQCPPHTRHIAATGQHMFFFVERAGGDNDDGDGGGDQSCIVTAADGQFQQKIPLSHGSFGSVLALTSFFVVQRMDVEGYNAFGNTHVLAVFPRSAAVFRVATHAEQVLALCARFHYPLAQHQCQQRVPQPGVLVQISNEYANQLWRKQRQHALFLSRVARWPVLYPAQRLKIALTRQLQAVERFPALPFADALSQLSHSCMGAEPSCEEDTPGSSRSGDGGGVMCVHASSRAEDVLLLLAALFKLCEFSNQRRDMWQALFWIKCVLHTYAIDTARVCDCATTDDAEAALALRKCLTQVEKTGLWTLMKESNIFASTTSSSSLPVRDENGGTLHHDAIKSKRAPSSPTQATTRTATATVNMAKTAPTAPATTSTAPVTAMFDDGDKNVTRAGEEEVQAVTQQLHELSTDLLFHTPTALISSTPRKGHQSRPFHDQRHQQQPSPLRPLRFGDADPPPSPPPGHVQGSWMASTPAGRRQRAGGTDNRDDDEDDGSSDDGSDGGDGGGGRERVGRDGDGGQDAGDETPFYTPLASRVESPPTRQQQLEVEEDDEEEREEGCDSDEVRVMVGGASRASATPPHSWLLPLSCRVVVDGGEMGGEMGSEPFVSDQRDGFDSGVNESNAARSDEEHANVSDGDGDDISGGGGGDMVMWTARQHLLLQLKQLRAQCPEL
ncbi:hypothetical protein PTSG_11177 [Salpingoeca rosetta]|uniref:Uncharacterized protein n=1 Tax=Salpingoeca rosetta (strain ATCC 50818 / BSB-021) TaxID=946362 RepID=F2USN1_SALR5|nr:uncharacterized protein PTSG_11177 [Salpingoeca rosetta]EGD81140.1 hypothetical protein PTSG_11177 [Salpingoeca rosetta]|eukprot:XP_004987825.1 hypothetical protein PTSG_11177 [Salpingoeca rosetta]